MKYVPSPVRTVFVASGLDREAQARKDEFDLVHQPIAIEFWADMCQALQARICALEAQAAADARVVDAARRYVESIDGLSELYRRDAKQYTFEEDVLFRQISRDWRGVMLAALAARKEEA